MAETQIEAFKNLVQNNPEDTIYIDNDTYSANPESVINELGIKDKLEKKNITFEFLANCTFDQLRLIAAHFPELLANTYETSERTLDLDDTCQQLEVELLAAEPAELLRDFANHQEGYSLRKQVLMLGIHAALTQFATTFPNSELVAELSPFSAYNASVLIERALDYFDPQSRSKGNEIENYAVFRNSLISETFRNKDFVKLLMVGSNKKFALDKEGNSDIVYCNQVKEQDTIPLAQVTIRSREPETHSKAPRLLQLLINPYRITVYGGRSERTEGYGLEIKTQIQEPSPNNPYIFVDLKADGLSQLPQ